MTMGSRVKSLSDLTRLCSEEVFVRVRHGQNGASVDYVCDASYRDGQLHLATRVSPVGYAVVGTFDDGYDVPEIGLRVGNVMAEERNLAISGAGNKLTYARAIRKSDPTPAEIGEAIRSFIDDVAKARPVVDAMVREHIAEEERVLPKLVEKYQPQV